MGKIRKMAETVHPLFEKNKWLYLSGPSSHIPDVDELVDTMKMLKHDAKKGKTCVSTGRFMVRWDKGLKCLEYYLDLS